MTIAVFGSHVPLITDYPAQPPPPPAPPAPPLGPQPPQFEPIAFSVVSRASLYGVVGSAISSTTMATVTCADASMTIVQSEPVAGLTFSYAANVLSVAGTPTGSARFQRVVISYMSSDGAYTVRGSTTHEITIVNATEVLTIGDMDNAAGRIGTPMSATLASPSANYSCNVIISAFPTVPGLVTALAWTPGPSSSTGTLTIAGTPTEASTYSLTVHYNANGLRIGTSTHTVVVVASSAPIPAAPAPSPGPSPPAPSPPPTPSPAPAPGRGPDGSLTETRVLMRFDELTGLTTDEVGHTFTASGAALGVGAVREGALFTTRRTSANWLKLANMGGQSTQTVQLNALPIVGSIEATWAATESIEAGTATVVSVSGRSVDLSGLPYADGPVIYINFSSLTGAESQASDKIDGVVTGAAGSAGALTVECMVDIDEKAWDFLQYGDGKINRYCPAVTLITTDGQMVWSLGFFSTSGLKYSQSDTRRVVMSAFLQRRSNGDQQLMVGTRLANRPGRYIHLAGHRSIASGTTTTTGWTDGRAADGTIAGVYTYQAAATGTARIGGRCPGIALGIYGGVGAGEIPFTGGIDEVRITAASRYTSYIDSTLPLAARVLPWPNY